MKNKIYYNVGLFKNILICLYDLMLLFSVLFFMSIPIHILTNGDAIITPILRISQSGNTRRKARFSSKV